MDSCRLLPGLHIRVVAFDHVDDRAQRIELGHGQDRLIRTQQRPLIDDARTDEARSGTARPVGGDHAVAELEQRIVEDRLAPLDFGRCIL